MNRREATCFPKEKPDEVAHPIKPLCESDNLLIGIVGGIPERSMADVVPEPEDEVTEILLHVFPKLYTIDVLVHGPMENKVGEGQPGIHQRGLALRVGNRPNANVRVLASNGSHPRVLGSLVEFIPIGNTRLDELLNSGAEICEGGVEQLGNKVQDILGGDLRVHVAVGEGAQEYNTPYQVGTIV